MWVHVLQGWYPHEISIVPKHENISNRTSLLSPLKFQKHSLSLKNLHYIFQQSWPILCRKFRTIPTFPLSLSSAHSCVGHQCLSALIWAVHADVTRKPKVSLTEHIWSLFLAWLMGWCRWSYWECGFRPGRFQNSDIVNLWTLSFSCILKSTLLR